MASSFIANTHQVKFESVLVIPDNEGMLNMFRAVEVSGLRGFLGCQSVLYEQELEQFFDTALVQNGDITGAVSGKFFSISQSRFAEVFELPKEGLVDFSEVPKNLVYDSRRIFSKSGDPAGSFDAVTNERFLMMTAIKFGLKVNWSKVLFIVFKEMVDKTQKKAKGYAAQICVLLKSNPAIAMGEAVPFQTSKVLSIKTVHTYIAMNQTIDARVQSDKPGMVPVEIVKRKSKSKKESESTGEAPVEVVTEVVSNKRPTVAGDEPVVPKKRRTVKEKLLPRKTAWIWGSDDETVEERVTVATIEDVEQQVTVEVADEEPVVEHTDEVDVIIGQDTAVDKSENFEQWLDESYEDFVATETVDKAEGSKDIVGAKAPEKDVGRNQTDEELMSIADLLMEMVALICGDVEFLVQLRDQVMIDVVEFFNSFSLNKLFDLESLRDLKEKEKLMLSWAEADSLEMVVRRRVYIIAKYREMLLRKFLDSHRKYYTPGQPWTATASQIIDLLSVAHFKYLEDLLAQQKEHGLVMERASSSAFLDDSNNGDGAVLAQFFSLANSTCWIRPMVLIDGVWTPIQGKYYWRSSCRLSLFVNKQQIPYRAITENSVPHCFFIEPVQYWGAALSIIHSWGWYRVCTEIISVFQHGRDSHSFVGYFSASDVQQSSNSIPDIDLLSSDGSTVYRSPSPQFDAFQEADSSGPNVQLALGPSISVVAQEEQLYFVQSPESPPPTSQRQDPSTSSTDSSMRFNSDGFSMDDTAANQSSLPATSTTPSASLDALQTFISKRLDNQSQGIRKIDESQNDVLSKLNTLEKGLRDTLRKQEEAFRTLIHSARQDGRTIGDVQTLRFNEFRKGVLAHSASVTADLMDVRKEVKAINVKVTSLDEQVAATRNDFLDFSAKAQETLNIITDQLSELVAYINRGGDNKKGEVSSQGPNPPPDDQGRTGGSSGNRGSHGSSGGSRSRGDRGGHSKKIYSNSSGGPFRRLFEELLG
ncbi:hypothetical protein F511_32978 [Dorcoceras hygrometricum]|uniref:Dystroglycan-like n=1 Tax=Dorcoceras hygrometricum TaxID=472368 RepID=A0A2Z7BJF9_9LAMI|nr:hypothetical protein F511_32978 [Dorcoceras hygrometricum]